MRDLSSPTAFRKHNEHAFDRIISRVIQSDQWDAKLDAIKDWEKEQELAKNRDIDDDIGPGIDYNSTIEMTPDEKSHQIAQTKQTQYGVEVNNVRQQLGVNQRSQFNGVNPNAMNTPKQNPLSKWLTFGKFGRSLSTLEIENNKKLLNGARDKGQGSLLDGMGLSQGVSIKETPAQQEFRMNVEDWKSYLYSYRLSAFFTALSIIDTLGGLNVLFTPGYYPLLASVASLLFLSYKLADFDDGPFKQNYLGNEDNLIKYQNAFKQQQAQEKNKQDSQEKDAQNYDQNDDLFDENNLDDYNELDSLDDDSTSDSDENSGSSNSIENNINSDSTNNEHVTHVEQAEFNDDGTSIPQSKIDVNNDENLYESEEEFLRMIYRNRAELSKHMHTPYDILKTFAPLIVNFNKEFADTKTISRGSWEFKNICYLIGYTYQQINSTFKTAGNGKDAKYDPNYYFFVDEIKETGLFYKIHIKLPDCINRETILKNIQTMKNTLKLTENDVVDIGTELPNKSGYIKIYKITTSKDGKNAFLPLVSTGDVMRFKGMETIAKKPLIEDLSAPDDLKILMGLSNAENALTLDIAGDQNTSIAIAGFTGSGKTASTGSWLTNILVTHSPDEVGFIIVDPKSGSFWENFRLAPHVLGYFNGEEVDKIPSMMTILKGVEIARQNHLNKDVRAKNYYEARKLFKTQGDWERVKTVPRLFIVMDEQLALSSSLQNIDGERNAVNKGLPNKEKKFSGFYESYKSQVGGLANIVREGGMTIMALSQRTVDKAFPRSLLSASSIKFMMKLQFTSDAEKLLGEGAEYPDPTSLPTGSGYLMANGLRLTQLTTPLFSGNPDRLEEVTRIIGLAWTILYDYDHDLTKEPPYYYLSEQSKENVKTMNAQGIDIYNIFNRDKIFEEAKAILRGDDNQELHFDPLYKSDFKLDLDADANHQDDVSLRDTNQDKLKYTSMPTDLNSSTEHIHDEIATADNDNLELSAKEDSNIADFSKFALKHDDVDQSKQDNINQTNIESNNVRKTNTEQNNSIEDKSINFDNYDEIDNDDQNNNTKNISLKNTNKDNSSLDEDIPDELSFNDLINRTSTENNNSKQSSKSSYSFDNDMSDAHKEQYENEYLQEVYDDDDASDDNIQDEIQEKDSNSDDLDNKVQQNQFSQNKIDKNDNENNSDRLVLDGEFTEVDTNQNSLANNSHQDNLDENDIEQINSSDSIEQINSSDNINKANINQNKIKQNNLNNGSNKNDIAQINTEQDNVAQGNTEQINTKQNNTEQNNIEKNNIEKSIIRKRIIMNSQNQDNSTKENITKAENNNDETNNDNSVQENIAQNNSAQKEIHQAENDEEKLANNYKDNPSEIIRFFKDNDINVIKTKELLKYFSFKSITKAIQKNLVTIDSRKNEVKINYH